MCGIAGLIHRGGKGGEIGREMTLYEVAIMTRAAPARLLGLADRGHLGAGAAADVAVYREAGDAEATFARAAWLIKDGVSTPEDRLDAMIDTAIKEGPQ